VLVELAPIDAGLWPPGHAWPRAPFMSGAIETIAA
jgi:hypothetical protein